MYCTHCSERISELAEICPKCGVKPFVTKNFCHFCGSSVNSNQAMCIKCGTLLKEKSGIQHTNSTNPIIIGILSFLVVGLGQMVMGQNSKGIIMFIVSTALAFLTFFSIFITVPLSIIDGVLIAKKKQQGKQVSDWEFF